MPYDAITRVLFNISLLLTASNAKTFEFRLIQSNNIQRQELLQQKCDKYHYTENMVDGKPPMSVHELSEVDMEHLLIDKTHKFLYCYVPKVSTGIYCGCELKWSGNKSVWQWYVQHMTCMEEILRLGISGKTQRTLLKFLKFFGAAA